MNTNTKTEKRVVPQTAGEKYGLTIQENPLRFMFRSDERANVVHVVDLDPMQYDERLGRNVKKWEECTCEHFTMRIRPLLQRGTVLPDTPAARCKHIRRARKILTDKTRDMISTAWNRENPGRCR